MAILSISFLESVFAGVVASAIYGGGLELIGLSKYNKPIELLLKGAFSKAVKKYFSKHPEIADQYEIKHSREYIKHLKDNVFNFGVGVKDGNIQHEILSLFEKEIHKNPLLRWWITYNQNKYTHEKLNQIIELANNHIFHIQKDIKDVKEGIQRIGAALGVKKLVISNDILSDNPNIISSNIARRENVICELIDIMQKKPCVVITGTKRIGKTTLLYLLEANLKALGQLHRAIFVNNDYCKDVLISSLLSSYNLDNITHIIIDGISFSTSDTDNINWGFIKELTDKGINVIISSYDNIPRSFLTVNVDFAQEYNIPNLEQLDIESILPSYNAPNNLGKLIYSFTNGHPILVNALLLYLQKQDWCVTDNTWDDLFSNSYASGVDETLARIIQKLIADPMDRELFNRLLLVMGRLSDKELEIIAEIEPRIDSPRMRFNSFKNLFFESYSDNKYRATKLFRSAWKPDLVKSVRVEVNKQLGLYLIHNTQLNQLTICEAIMYLQNGGEIDLAGYIYIQYLISVAQNPQYIESKNEIALSFWADLPLPISMDIDIKLMIRYFQMLVNVNKKEKYDYLRNDYIELLSSYNKTDANKSFFYKVIGSITLLYDDVSNGLLYYRQAVQLGIPEIGLVR